MTSILVTNDLKALVKVIKVRRKSVSFLNVEADSRENQLVQYLKTQTNAEEISHQNLLRSNRNSFKDQYIKSIGMINKQNCSTNWWSIPFTDKNPFDPELCRSVASLVVIVNYLKTYSGLLIIITSNTDLARQLIIWAKSNKIEATNAVRSDRSFRDFLKQYTPAGIVKGLCRTVYFWSLTRSLKPDKNLKEQHIVITSLGHLRSFNQPNQYRDIYFGRLVNDFQDHGEKVVILALLMEKQGQQVRQIKGLNGNLPVLPIESCLTILDIIRCVIRSFYMFFGGAKLIGTADIEGIDFSFLVKQTIRDACHTGNCFMALRMYYASRWLASRIAIKRCIYIYENLPWERMLVLGVREASRGTRMLGYQHASVTQSHINMLLAEEELGLVPVPDVILTTGQIVNGWLEKEGNYLEGMLKVGCSLRQTWDENKPMPNRIGPLQNILIALATSETEYIKVLHFIDDVIGDNPGYQFRIRPHPSIALTPVLKRLYLAHDTLLDISDVSLDDDLDWSDLVLYASSTVGMEAVVRGIPAVYIDLGDHLDTDPMSGWNDFKWSVQEPTDFKIVMNSISDIPDITYFNLQASGLQYVTKYLSPVTLDPADVFSEA